MLASQAPSAPRPGGHHAGPARPAGLVGERFPRMGWKQQAVWVVALVIWVGMSVGGVYTIKGGVRRFRAAAPGRRWLVLAAWGLRCVVLWTAFFLVCVLALTVI